MSFEILPAIPIIRMFDVAQARAFYVDYLGFEVDWEHRHTPELPLDMQVSRSGCLLHLSEHHGDTTPGSRNFIRVHGIAELHAELQSKGYARQNPGLERMPWGLQVEVTDPFGNRLTFCEQQSDAG